MAFDLVVTVVPELEQTSVFSTVVDDNPLVDAGSSKSPEDIGTDAAAQIKDEGGSQQEVIEAAGRAAAISTVLGGGTADDIASAVGKTVAAAGGDSDIAIAAASWASVGKVPFC